MRIPFRTCWLALLASLWAASGRSADPVYENFGLVTEPPQIDAVTFINRGIWDIATLYPFETQNTRSFTNFGSMTGSVGFRFDRVSSGGVRAWADSIVNRGSLIGVDSGGFGFQNIGASPIGSYVELYASSIVNQGLIEVGPRGIVRIKGGTVNLTRSAIRAGASPEDTGSARGGYITVISDNEEGNGRFYFNPDGVTDLYGGAGVNGLVTSDSSGQTGGFPLDVEALTTPLPQSPLHQVVYPAGFTNFVSLPFGFGFYDAWVWTNQISATNFLTQVVFVQTNSTTTNLTVDVRFSAFRQGQVNQVPGSRVALVELGLVDVDPITGNPATNRVYLLDSMATTTNAVLETNITTRITQPKILKPSTFEVVLNQLFEWEDSEPTNAIFSPDLLAAGFDTTFVTNNYAAYGFLLGVSQVNLFAPGGQFNPVSPLGGFYLGTEESGLRFGGFGNPRLTDVTNLPGRVEVEADNLDLNLLRLKADGVTTFKSDNFSGRDPRRVDAPGFRLQLANSGSTLTVSNVVPAEVLRLDGEFYAYSAVWTNYQATTDPDGNTNQLEFRFHALIVERASDPRRPVAAMEVALKATNVVWADRMLATRSLVVDASGFHNYGEITYATGEDLDASSFPRLTGFTNSGIFEVPPISVEGGSLINPGVAVLGADTTNGWLSLLNTGEISAGSLRIRADVVETLGTLESTLGTLQIEGRDIKFDGIDGERGVVSGIGDVVVKADDFKFRNTDFSAGQISSNPVTGTEIFELGSITLDVVTRLSDNDQNAANEWFCTDGVRLLRKPTEATLLGTRLVIAGERFREVVSLWSAEDRGPSAEGYVNNAALGTLTLDGDFFTLFTFGGTASGQALYVDFLELLNEATNVLENLNIAEGFTLYFADSNLPADQLDGLSDGRLRWVPDYAGPQSSVLVRLANGSQVKMNRALVSSRTIDSDGDGTPNGLDTTPFEPAALKVKMSVRHTSSQAEVSWLASPGRSYRVEYTTDLASDAWTPLETVTNGQPAPRDMAVQDAVAVGGPSRFYRVVEVR